MLEQLGFDPLEVAERNVQYQQMVKLSRHDVIVADVINDVIIADVILYFIFSCSQYLGYLTFGELTTQMVKLCQHLLSQVAHRHFTD